MDARWKMPYERVLNANVAAQYDWVEERNDDYREITVALNLVYYSAYSNQLPATRTMNLRAMCAEWESWVVMSGPGRIVAVLAAPGGISFVIRFISGHLIPWTIPTRLPEDFIADKFSLVLPLYEALFGETLKMLYAGLERPRPYPLLCPRILDEILDYFDFDPDVLVPPYDGFRRHLVYLPDTSPNGLAFMVKALGGQVTYDRDDDRVTDEFVDYEFKEEFANIIPRGGRTYISMRKLSFCFDPFIYNHTLIVYADEFPLDIPGPGPGADAAVVVPLDAAVDDAAVVVPLDVDDAPGAGADAVAVDGADG